eukprot:CAMPEP_0184867940 /NCGR_PEP_ID=MMETSP0580-20130426/28427_1 /TAXON_ID=1118495 /ORGANISM="Dactyliosolen fragilissimus" /LENGTH=602 /DNA_ID=CAMNT_0027368491 /DNA_START=56 /DNA_END=1861 /DNA_ORIENTATION=+
MTSFTNSTMKIPRISFSILFSFALSMLLTSLRLGGEFKDASSFVLATSSGANRVGFDITTKSHLLIPSGGAASSLQLGKQNGTQFNNMNHTSSLTYIASPIHSFEDREAKSIERDSAADSPSTQINSINLANSPPENISTNCKEDEITSELRQIEKEKGSPLKVLFLSADTGGGHRASAESLANQFMRKYPGTTYDLLDIWTPTQIYPYRTLVPAYKHLSANPRRWQLLYHISNTRWYELLADLHSTIYCRKKVQSYIEEYDPDVVVSVHPTMNFVPLRATRRIAKSKEKYIPFFTVVTDFGSGHSTWFQKGVDKLYIASERIKKLSKKRGNVPNEKIVMSGLPIRHDFAVQAEKMGDRTSESGKLYRQEMKSELGIDPKKKTILVMGGGEGVGSLQAITESMVAEFKRQGVDATICVVCGRNLKLKTQLESRDWSSWSRKDLPKTKTKRKMIRRIFSKLRRSKRMQEALDKFGNNDEKALQGGNVDVVGLGFITNMADYMVAADVLVSKAGPGTIAEAAAVGLPVMVTSYLPGQEAGNVDIVLDGEFGDFCTEPNEIANVLSCWLKDESLLEMMSRKSAKVGHPDAASNIVQDIGDITHEW